jgi:hypothetical protein
LWRWCARKGRGGGGGARRAREDEGGYEGEHEHEHEEEEDEHGNENQTPPTLIQLLAGFVAQVANFLQILISFVLFADCLLHERTVVEDHGQRLPV